jgi:hypothetical protein
LAGGYIDGSDDVAGVGVEAIESSSHSEASEVFEHVELHQGCHVGFENIPHHIAAYESLTNHGFSPPLNPVDGGGLFDRTEVTGDADYVHVREIVLEVIQDVLDAFGDHVHPHGIPRAAAESNVQILPEPEAGCSGRHVSEKAALEDLTATTRAVLAWLSESGNKPDLARAHLQTLNSYMRKSSHENAATGTLDSSLTESD